METEGQKSLNRREFVKTVSRWISWSGVAVIFGGLSFETLKFFVPKISYEPLELYTLGKPENYHEGVNEQWKTKYRIWLVRNERGLYALEARCVAKNVHFGCNEAYICGQIPSWFGVENHFKCWCCGTNYYVNGDVVVGPGRDPLYRLAIWKSLDGNLAVDKRQKENRAEFRDKPLFFLAMK